MFAILLESSMVGMIILIIGTIIFNLSINKENKDAHKPYGISTAFFMTGFITNLVLEYGGVNNYMCAKKSFTKCHMISKLN
jgi:hypothetical protein